MNEQLKKLRTAMGQGSTAARAILDKAEKEGRALTTEETQQYDKHVKDVADARATITRVEDQDRLEAGLREATADPIREAPAGESRDAAQSQAERRAFLRYLRGGKSELSSADRQILSERRDLSVGSDSSGGFTVPVELAKEIILKLKDFVWVRGKATVLPAMNAESLGIPTLSGEPDDADWTSEVATGNKDAGMAFGRRDLKPHPLAKRILVSRKLLRSSVIDVEALIRDRFAYKFGVTEEKAFLTGDGKNKPLGLFTASADGISTGRDFSTGNSTTAIGNDGLVEAKMGVKAQYRAKAEWMFHRDALKQIMKIKDGEGRYIWQPGLTMGAPDRLLNAPYNESEYAPNTFTSGKYVGLYGDLSYYWIVDSLAMEIQALYELYAESNQIGFIMRRETDGAPVLEEAFARVKLA